MPPRVPQPPEASRLFRVLRLHPGEALPVAMCAGYFFLVLLGYSMLRPVREAMGVERSMDDLRILFIATCAVSLVVAVGFGGFVARLDRARFIRVGHLGVAACLGAFVVARATLDERHLLALGYAFYVWLSVVNLFLTSVFWSFMADVWRFDQSKRVFPVIAVGGTLGAVVGSSLVWWTFEHVGVSWQMTLSGACFVFALPLVGAIDRRERAGEPPARVGGSWASGLALVLRSPYLLGAAAYVVFMTISNTLLYFTRAQLVSDQADELHRRVSMFAQMDAWTQGTTLFVQLFITGRMMRRLGIGVTLAVLPVVTVAGFAALAWLDRAGIEPWRMFGAVTAFSAVHTATRYAVARPTRETLFSVVSEEEKYKAKPVIDMFFYRGGDVAGAGLTTLAATMWGMLMLAAPLAAVWGGMCVWLAHAQRRRAAAADTNTANPGRAPAQGATP